MGQTRSKSTSHSARSSTRWQAIVSPQLSLGAVCGLRGPLAPLLGADSHRGFASHTTSVSCDRRPPVLWWWNSVDVLAGHRVGSPPQNASDKLSPVDDSRSPKSSSSSLWSLFHSTLRRANHISALPSFTARRAPECGTQSQIAGVKLRSRSVGEVQLGR